MREFALLDRLFALNAELPPSVLIPPGDDMALVSLAGSDRVLVAADSAIEGRHAPLGCDPYLIGKKAVLRNLSDVAAMGGARPVATIACAILPRGIDEARAWRLAEGLRETAARWGAPLVGGDIATGAAAAAGAGIIASVTILAVPLSPGARIATRADARAGDGVYVTGTIGGAWDRATGLGRHLDFTPRIDAAQELAATLGERLGAMIDVSDGLGRDLGHIAKQSGVAIEVDLARVPVPTGTDALDAIAHGEDYELAFTARGDVPPSVAGVAVTRIGIVVAAVGDARGVRARDQAGNWIDITRAGFEHDGSSPGGHSPGGHSPGGAARGGGAT